MRGSMESREQNLRQLDKSVISRSGFAHTRLPILAQWGSLSQSEAVDLPVGHRLEDENKDAINKGHSKKPTT